MLSFFKGAGPRGVRKTGMKKLLTYEEPLKRTEVMIKKVMRGLMRELLMISIIIMG